MRSFVGFIVMLAFVALATIAVSFSFSYPRYEVKKSWTDLSVVEIVDAEGRKVVGLTEDELKARGELYTTTWVAPKGF